MLKQKYKYWDENKFQYNRYKIKSRKAFIDDKLSYIVECSNFHKINPKLLYGILLVEHVNRGDWLTRTIESALVNFFINRVVKLDMSIGIGQIKISTARHFFPDEDLQNIAKKLLVDRFNMKMCAQILACYIYHNRNSENILLNVVKCYTTGKSITGKNPSIELYYSLLTWIMEGSILKKGYGYEFKIL